MLLEHIIDSDVSALFRPLGANSLECRGLPNQAGQNDGMAPESAWQS